MNYNTWTFWLLFFAVLVPYWRLTHKQQNVLLLAASYLFYGSWDYRFLTLMLIATTIDYVGGLGVAGISLSKKQLAGLVALVIGSVGLLCSDIQYGAVFEAIQQGNPSGLWAALPHELRSFYLMFLATAGSLGYLAIVVGLYRLPHEARRKAFVAVSMVANLTILGFFKYCDFFVESMRQLVEQLGFGSLGDSVLGIILPPGISFYTFQAMSYTIDIYRGEAKPTKNFADFALFVCFFPHLVAGPIMRASTLLPQVTHARRPRLGAFEEGLFLVLFGLFKKVVIADNMAPIANNVFFRYADGTAQALTGADILMGVYAFAFQIYGDFSGYSSIARGISKWLGFELVVNFHLPYLAVSPADFWRRWHISLSTWLRDYLYIPLGGNRHGSRATYRNLMLTMLLGGLWHGANWTFVVWGLYHGLLLCVFRALGIKDPAPRGGLGQRAYWLIRVLLMFHLTCIGWLVFRADSFTLLALMTRDLVTTFTWTANATVAITLIGFYCLIPFLTEWMLDGEYRLDRFVHATWTIRSLGYTYVTLMLLFMHALQTYDFIYFQF